MKKIIIRIFFFCGIFFLTLKICYADFFDWKDILNPYYSELKFNSMPLDVNIYTKYKDNLCNNFFENIDDFYSYYRHRHINRTKIGIHYFFVTTSYVLSIGWKCCGFIGFVWVLWAINRLYTGGAVDHD